MVVLKVCIKGFVMCFLVIVMGGDVDVLVW